MIQVELCWTRYQSELQETINQFLTTIKTENFIDIKYVATAVPSTPATDAHEQHTAVITYRKEDAKGE